MCWRLNQDHPYDNINMTESIVDLPFPRVTSNFITHKLDDLTFLPCVQLFERCVDLTSSGDTTINSKKAVKEILQGATKFVEAFQTVTSHRVLS